MKSIYSLLFILCFPLYLSAQEITGITTKWNDAFNEWTIYTLVDEDEIQGDLNMRWQMQNDWTEWDYRVGEETGSIQLKWDNDPSQWEIRGNNETITAKMIWNNDPTEWRITNNEITITLSSRWKNELTEWSVKEDKYGQFQIYTNWDNDPRDWNVEDELDEDITLPMKMAILFIVTFNSSPKE